MRVRTGAMFAILGLCGCNAPAVGGPSQDGALSVDAGVDATPVPDFGNNGSPSATFPAPHPAPPQVVSGGGPVMPAPHFVPVFFANDDAKLRPGIEDFLAKVGTTHYWKAISAEYGVGIASSGKSVALAEMAKGTLDDSAIQTWLLAKLNGNDPAFPVPDHNTLFVLTYPAEVTITLSSGQGGVSQSCAQFGGYHSNVTLNAVHNYQNVAYAVIPTCSAFGDMSGLDVFTATLSHEIIEAATDPFPMTRPAYTQVDDDHAYWEFILGGGEVGDMCAQFPKSFTRFPELDYVVQRSWSNTAATDGHDPCVPSLPGEVYFNAVPELNDMLTLGGGQVTVSGVNVPVSATKTIDLDLYSDADTGGAWAVKVSDASGSNADFKFSLDRTIGQNGEKLHLTISSIRANQYGAGVFKISATHGTQRNVYFGIVGQ